MTLRQQFPAGPLLGKEGAKRIVVLDGYTLNPGDNPWDRVGRLGELVVYERTPPDEIVNRAQGAAIVVTNKAALTAETLARLPTLRFIAITATGYNVVDVDAARERGITVANVPEYGTDSVAQHAVALLLELCTHVGAHADAVRAGEWTRQPDFCFRKTPLVELAGLAMGIVGFGRIGRRVGMLAHAFGMHVIAAGGRRHDHAVHHPVTWMETAELFAAADVVSLHCPLTTENAAFVNHELLERMKPTAFLINTARGGLIDEHALADTLNAGRLAGAAADVVSHEPIRPDNPLLGARNCILTPHIAWATLAARRRLMAATALNVEAFLAGRLINVVS